MEYRTVTNCRICGSDKLKKYLDLGAQPLANALLPTKDSISPKYPLIVMFCEECALSQLSVVVEPSILYANYPYHSSVSKTFQEHCRKMARTLKLMYQGEGKPLVVDIASNDGCLLEQFQEEGYYILGVEPSENLAREANECGISTINDFWSEKAGRKVPACDFITATNVLAHVDDVRTFIKLAATNLHVYSKGIMVVEVPYLYNLISKNQFDTVYHEHLSYFLLRPLLKLFQDAECPIFKVEQHAIHGGSLRIYASPHGYEQDASVNALIAFEHEEGLYEFKTYAGYAARVAETREKLCTLLAQLKVEEKKVVGYCASAKGTIMMNYCNIDSTDISAVIDETAAKQGKFIPGCNIPVVNSTHFDISDPDYIVLLSWNFADELMNKTKDHAKKGGKYIVTSPEVKVI